MSATLTIRNAHTGLTGSYVATVTMPTPNDPIELDSEMVFAVVNRPVATLDGTEDGRMFIGQLAELWGNVLFDGPSEVPPVFKATGLPPGLTIDQDGFILGTPTTTGLYTISLTVSLGRLTSLPVTRRFVVTPPGLAIPGLYWGWLEGHPAFPLRGFVTLDLRPEGTYTGSFQTGLHKEPITGYFPLDSEGGIYDSILSRLTYRFPGAQPQRSAWLRHVTGHELQLLTMSSGGQPGDPELLSPLELIKPLVSPQTPPAELGKHTFAVLASGDPVTTPGGHSFGTLTVAADRRITYTGQLAEGTAITGAGWLSDQSLFSEEAPQFYFYATDTAGKNSLRGRVGLSLVTGEDVAEPTGEVLWTRLPATGKLYPEGYEDISLPFISSRYSAAAAGAIFSPAPSYLEIYPLITDPLAVVFQFSPQLRALFGTGAGENLPRARLDVYAPTGFFTGQATIQQSNVYNPDRPITRTVNYRGMLLPDARHGYGWFTLPTAIDSFIPASEALTYSSPILITPAGGK